MRLGDLADISTGLVINRKAADVIDTNIKKYKLLTLKSFDDDGWINDEFIDTFESSEDLSDKYITQINDLVIRLSFPYTCISIDKETTDLLVPSQFAIIRPRSTKCVSTYIAFLLNSDHIRTQFIKSSLGATISVIRVTSLRETDIPSIELNKQEIIANIQMLTVKRKRLYNELKFQMIKQDKALEMKMIRKVESNIYRKG